MSEIPTSAKPASEASLAQPKYWPAWLGIACCRLMVLLPYSMQLASGRCLGWLAWHLVRSRRAVVLRNLQLSFPEKTPTERTALAKAHFLAAGMGLFEVAMAWWLPAKRVKKLAHITGLEHLQAALASGRGALLLSGHFTCLEIAVRCVADQVPTTAMYRPHNNAAVAYEMKRVRDRHSSGVIPHRDVRGLIRGLKDGKLIWYAADQSRPSPFSVITNFFAEPALTNAAIGRLASRSNALIIPFFMRRRADGSGYEIDIQAPLTEIPSGDAETDAKLMNQAIEAAVLNAPEQYLWLHKRYKGRGEGYPDAYADSAT